jgi:hypothetical protein
MKSTSKSIIVLPFKIVNEDINNNPFDFKNQSQYINEDQELFSQFLNKMKTFDCDNEKIVDIKYHDFVSSYISNQKEDQIKSFLKFYSLSPEYYIKQKVFNFNKNKFFLAESDVEFIFHKNTYIITNENARICYLVLNFELLLEDVSVSILDELSKLEFFRYYKPKQVEKNSSTIIPKYQIRVQQGINEEALQYSLFSLVLDYFKPIISNIKFLYDRPITLHLFNSDNGFNDTGILNKKFYNSLRVPVKLNESEQDLNTFINEIKTPDLNIRFMAMNEGGIVIDRGCSNLKDLVNKYFPAFILALNQREIMIMTNRKISTIDYDKVLKNNLSKLKNDIHLFQLKQMFYSISFISEIDQFFCELQNKFRIETLLRDNKEGIFEINALLEKERNDQIANLLVILSIVQGVTAFFSIFGEMSSISLKFIILLSFFLIYFILYMRKKKNNLL